MAGAAVLLSAGPAMADPKKSKGARGNDISRNVDRDYRQRDSADLNGDGIIDYRERRFVDRNRNGIDDRREDYRYSDNRYGGAACPPGLAKKNPPCVPPGQAKRLFREGQRIGAGYRYYTPYGDIPGVYRNDINYGLNDDYRYIYRNDYLYEVDPTTSLVRRIISLIGR